MEFRSIISAEELERQRAKSDVAVLDCRFDLMDPEAGRRAWLEGHIPGASYAHLDHDLSGATGPDTGRHPLPDATALAGFLGRAGVGPGRLVVCYDQASGAIAARAWWLLRWLGHDRVAVLDGGYAAWLANGGETRVGEESIRPQTFAGSPERDWVVSTREIVDASRGAASLRLIDAREGPRFRGEVEPIDTVAGHVPGATNLFYGDTLRDDATMREPWELRALFERALAGDLEAPWSAMCGSGVTACQLAVAARHAGVRAPRIYAGSFSEWIRDAGRPVASGAG